MVRVKVRLRARVSLVRNMVRVIFKVNIRICVIIRYKTLTLIKP